MRRVEIVETAVIETIDGTMRLSPEEGLAKKRSTSREASRLVADYAEDPEGEAEGTDATSEVTAAFKKKHSDLPPIETKLPDWTRRNSCFTGIVAKTTNTADSQLLLYPYGIDEPVAIDTKADDDQYGDGLISFEEGRLFLDIKRDEEQPTEKKGSLFNRKAFTWRVASHRLLGNPYAMPEGGAFTEQVINRSICELYAEKRGDPKKDSSAVVIQEWDLCWLLAELADKTLPDPPVVFSRKGKAAKHVKIQQFIGECKMYIYEKPVTDQDYNRVVCRCLNIKKVQDESNPFEEKLSPMKAMRVVESGDGQGFFLPDLGMSAKDM
jgi:hypothetical protein